MTEGLDMSLDDIIKNNKRSGLERARESSFRGRGGGRGRGRGRGGFWSGPGPTRRFDNRAPNRSSPYSFVPQAIHMQEMFVGGDPSSEEGTKLYVSNLDYGVTNEDIKVLFSDVGDLKRYSIHYDRSGRSKGTAEVVFVRQSDAIAAMKRYNNVQLDGKPMQLELVGVKIVAPVPVPAMQKGILGGTQINASRSVQGRIIGRGQDRPSSGVRGPGRGRGMKGRPQKVSAEDLDADLEKYRLEALKID